MELCWYCKNDISNSNEQVYISVEFDTVIHESCLYNELDRISKLNRKAFIENNPEYKIEDTREIDIVVNEILDSDIIKNHIEKIKNDFNYHGLLKENIRSLTNQSYLRLILQNKIFGFDDTEHWNLDNSIASYIYPRLKKFREDPLGYPSDLSEKEWHEILGKMMHSFEHFTSGKNFDQNASKEIEKVQEGLNLFAKYYNSLWN